MCCEIVYDSVDIDGECPECGRHTVDGSAYERCHHSRSEVNEECETCGHIGCDGSC